MLQVEPDGGKGGGKSAAFSSVAPTQRLKTFLGGDTDGADQAGSQPIADLVRKQTKV